MIASKSGLPGFPLFRMGYSLPGHCQISPAAGSDEPYAGSRYTRRRVSQRYKLSGAYKHQRATSQVKLPSPAAEASFTKPLIITRSSRGNWGSVGRLTHPWAMPAAKQSRKVQQQKSRERNPDCFRILQCRQRSPAQPTRHARANPAILKEMTDRLPESAPAAKGISTFTTGSFHALKRKISVFLHFLFEPFPQVHSFIYQKQ